MPTTRPFLAIVTVGVKILADCVSDPAGRESARIVQQQARNRQRISETSIAGALRGRLGDDVPAGIDIGDINFVCLDCRPFWDPERSRREVNHLGMHPSVLLPFTTHSSFNGWLCEARQKILAAVSKGPTVIVTYCNKGRHRSVAAATVLDYCSSGDSSLPTSSFMMHTASGHWVFGACDECRECRSMTTSKLEGLVTARAKWLSYH